MLLSQNEKKYNIEKFMTIFYYDIKNCSNLNKLYVDIICKDSHDVIDIQKIVSFKCLIGFDYEISY